MHEVRTQPAAAVTVIGKYRWTVCALLFFASAVNYVDRQVLGILKPTLQQEFGWSEIDYGAIVQAFQLAYGIGLVAVGRFIDRVGTRRGFAVAITVWSIAAMAHAGVLWFGPPVAAALGAAGLVYSVSVAGFIAARFALGLGEAANFPAGIRTVAEWFPRRERALATGIFNAGTNVGAVVAPLVVPWLTYAYGWRAAFVVTGAAGFIWLAAWWRSYDEPTRHRSLGAAELAYIRQDPSTSDAPIAWRAILPHRQTWAFAAGKLITDPIWWVYLFWIPDFLSRNHGLDLTTMGPPLVAIFLAADVGSVAGGWLSSSLLTRGWTVSAARKTAMFVCALAVVPIVFAARTTDLWTAVALIGLAVAAHQGWSCNLFTLTSDMFPRQAVGSVVGVGGFMGAIGGMLIAGVTASILQVTGSYVPVFIMAACAYPLALLCIPLLAPRLEPASLAASR